MGEIDLKEFLAGLAGKPYNSLIERHLELFQQSLAVGGPGNWRPLAEGLRSGGLIAVEDSPSPGELCAVDAVGQSYLVRDGGWRALKA